MRWWLAGAVLTLVAVIAAIEAFVVVPAVLEPRLDPLGPADAVVVLGGYGDGPLFLANQIHAAGLSPVVVISDPGPPGDTTLVQRTCAQPPPGYYCFVPSPDTTLGEARQLRDYADTYGWRRVQVVTGSTHVERARYIVGQCWGGELAVTHPGKEIPPRGTPYAIAYQTLGFVKAWFADC